MDDYRSNPDGFQENDVARHAVADVRIRRIHKTATIFDDESCAAEFLDIGQRFKQRGGFGDELLHVRA